MLFLHPLFSLANEGRIHRLGVPNGTEDFFHSIPLLFLRKNEEKKHPYHVMRVWIGILFESLSRNMVCVTRIRWLLHQRRQSPTLPVPSLQLSQSIKIFMLKQTLAGTSLL